MARTEISVWGIHAGKTGDADRLFFDHKVIALGWPRINDLMRIQPQTREGFKSAFYSTFQTAKPGAVANSAGQLFRFVHELAIDDYVVYPSKVDRKVHIGKVIGQYQYAANIEPAYPHHRSVEWIKVVPRTSLSQGFLYTIGSAMSFFRADGYSEEFLAVLKGAKTAAPPPEDPTLQIVAQEIEQTTRDFLLKQFSRELRGHPFAEFVAHVLELMGYRTRVSPPGIDGGIDIVAHKDELGFEPPIIKVQVKSSDSSIGAPEVQALYGNVNAANGEFGLFVALGGFTLPAQTFAKSKSNLRLINSEEFVDLVLQNYERLDSRYKGLLPLKHVYVPEPLTDSAESES